MTDAIKLSASARQSNVDIKDFIPGVVYGAGMETKSLTVKRVDFEKVFANTGESGLISLELEGEKLPVLVKDLQYDAVKHRVIHADFYKLNMNEKVVAEASLEFIGEAPAVKNHGGIVVEHMDQLEIECLPTDLIQKIEIDLSKLENLGDAIYVKDIVLPKGVEAKDEAEAIVVHVVEPKKVVEEAPAAAAETAAPEASEEKTEEKAEDKKE